jgi:hypothetical protein
MWVLILLSEQYAGLSEVMNKWLTLSRQIQYLMAQEALEKSDSDI